MIAYSIINTFYKINLWKHKKQHIIAVKKIGIQRLYFYWVVNVDSLVSSFITMRDTVTCVSILLQNIVKCQSLGWIITIIICNQFFCYFVMTLRILFDVVLKQGNLHLDFWKMSDFITCIIRYLSQLFQMYSPNYRVKLK